MTKDINCCLTKIAMAGERICLPEKGNWSMKWTTEKFHLVTSKVWTSCCYKRQAAHKIVLQRCVNTPPAPFQKHSPSACWALRGAVARRGAAHCARAGGTHSQSGAVAGVAAQVPLRTENCPRGAPWWARLRKSRSGQTVDPWNPWRLDAFTEENQ